MKADASDISSSVTVSLITIANKYYKDVNDKLLQSYNTGGCDKLLANLARIKDALGNGIFDFGGFQI